MVERNFEELRRFLHCRIELFDKFMHTPEKLWFDEEFTFENWLKGSKGVSTFGGAIDIRTRNLKTPMSTISSGGFHKFGKFIPVDDNTLVQEIYHYSQYRFQKYNFNQKIYINGKEVRSIL